jgi:hypothetical protein
MTYTALGVLFVLTCIAVGALAPAAAKARLAAVLALVMVAAQFALLMWRT